MANVATLMSTAPIPHDGQLHELCEFQGVLIQWFMMADSFWVLMTSNCFQVLANCPIQVLCMATNVFLVFFWGYDSLQLRHLEKWYLLLSYGIPAIPALTYVILDHSGHRIMGPATVSSLFAPSWHISDGVALVLGFNRK